MNRTDIIAKIVEEERRKIHVYASFTAHTDIGDFEVVLKNPCLLHSGYQRVIEIRKGATSEFLCFITRYFANRCFDELRRKYGQGA